MKYPDISNAIVEKKTENIDAAGANTLLAGDLGCLMNMAGKLKRAGIEGRGPPCRRGAGRHDRHAADRRTRLSAWKSPRPPSSRIRPAALADQQLQKALGNVRGGFIDKRRKAVEALPEFDRLRDNARDIKDHALDNLDLYLEAYEAKVVEAGGQVHWAETAEEARDIMLDICRAADARTVTKGKSMITEEIELNDFLERNGIRPVETDLGEYIIQLRHEHPSHIIAPAVHLNKEQVEADFRRVHTHLPAIARPHRAGGAAQRGARRAAPEVFRGRCRHHRRQFPGRRDRHLDHRHQ